VYHEGTSPRIAAACLFLVLRSLDAAMTESKLLRPAQVLFERERQLPDIPAVDHYAGSEKFMRRALALQAEMGPVFDVTLDCEDGAPAGNEKAHDKDVRRARRLERKPPRPRRRCASTISPTALACAIWKPSGWR